MKSNELNYRQFLIQELEARKRRNSGYSLRSFARDLGMPSSKLSEVMNAKCGLSDVSAKRISDRLKLSANEEEIFIHLVRAEHSRSPKVKHQSKTKIQALKESLGYTELDLERFKIIADWHHFAILELSELQDFKSDFKWIAERLAIPTIVVKESITRLLDFGLLELDPSGRYVQTKLHLATPSGISSRVIRDHHLQVLKKAESAITDLPAQERDISSTMLAISAERLGEAREYLKIFRRKFCQDLQAPGKKDRVFCLAVQFFPIDELPNLTNQETEHETTN